MKTKRSMKIKHIGSINNESNIEVEVLIISLNKSYLYKASKYIEEQFLKKYKKSYGGWSSLNYLKTNSNLIEE